MIFTEMQQSHERSSSANEQRQSLLYLWRESLGSLSVLLIKQKHSNMSSEETPAEGESGSSLLLNQPVVIDNGTSTLKAGFAGSSKPKVSRK
jgi:hypothetical protein